MNARTKAVTIWTALCATAIAAGVLVLGRSAETQVSTPVPPVELVSIAANGGQPNGNSSGAIPNADGRCVAYYTDATNILPFSQDANGFTDVYLYDRDSGQTTRVSVGLNGQNPNGPSMAQGFRPSIDSDCTCVSFSSDATNLVPDDTNGKTDVFVHLGLPAGTTELASVGLDGEPANGASSFTSLSGDCSKVAFHSVASNLVPDDTNNVSDVFVFDLASGETTRVSVGPGGEQADGASITPSMSADGRCVAFASAATNLLPSSPDTNKTLDIYVECDGVVTCRASVSSSGEEANDMSFLPALNADGTIVAFKSNASNLVSNDTNQVADVFVHDCVSGETVRASVGDDGQQGNDIAIPPSISGDGRFVAFGSFANDLIAGVNTHNSSQVYVRDLVNETTELISTSPFGQAGDRGVPDLPPSISGDGTWVAFASLANNLVPSNRNLGYQDAYIRANVTLGPTSTATSTSPPAPTPTQKIPCSRDTDCPVGQVCGPDKVCVPAPTPTPTIACTDDSVCPPPEVCVNGVCRDLSTPTVTPTPLPTCTMDSDCPDDTVCRAMVCVPRRTCTNQDQCRGIRETCLNDFCECGGDCNLDGIVFGSDITTMVQIMAGNFPLSDCPAGDINQDGHITSADVTLAVINLGLGCPGEGSPLIFAQDRTNETRTIDVATIMGIPGQFVTVPVSVTGGGDVTTAQVDILYDQSLLAPGQPTSNGGAVDPSAPACTLDPRILAAGTGFEAEVTMPQTPSNPPGQGRLRVAVVDKMPPVDSFDAGVVFNCTFRIQPGAVPGSYQLSYDLNRLEIADPQANTFSAQASGGAVVVTESTTPCTTDEMCPTGTQCKGGVCKPIVTCDGPMAGPTQCLPNNPGPSRQACVNNQCVCVGDCNNDGEVRGNEVTIMINIINGVQPLSMCPSADYNGDGEVRGNEVTIAINNINDGCP